MLLMLYKELPMSDLSGMDHLRPSHRARPRPRAAQRCRRRVLELEALEARAVPAGTWTALANSAPSPTGTGTMLLLTDGTALVQGGGVANTWYKLTPDAHGSYANGTWSQVASMNNPRLFYASDVLPSGKVFVVGGEYSGPAGAQNETNTGEIYDPAADSWTPIPNFPLSVVGDDPSEVLPNGKVLVGSILGADTYFYDPAANAWSPAGTKLREDSSSEEGWVKLGDGSILSYDVGWVNNGGTSTAQRYVPSTNTWVDAGSVPVVLSSYYELGPGFLLPDGRALYFGDNGTSAYYTPSTNSWAAGPTLPSGLAASDVPGAVLPNGDVLLAAGTNPHNGGVDGPTNIFELNPLTNTFTAVTPGAGTLDMSGSATNDRMLVLPSGQVLLTTGGDQLAVYTPAGAPNSAWRPTVTSVVSNGGLTYTLTGTQLNGLSEGASFGDDAQMSSNYPIVQLISGSGAVSFARTFNWTSQVATGSNSVTTQFTLPAGLPVGNYTLTVVAGGIASAPFAFTAPLAVTGSTPAAGSAVAAPPTSFVVNFNEPVLPGTVQPDALQVNGIAATGVSLNGSDTSATFTYGTSPVTAQGVQTMSIAAHQITGQDGSQNTAYSAPFNYDAVTLAVTATSPAAGSVISLAAGGTLTYDVTVNEPIDPATAGAGNLVLSQGQVTAVNVLPGNTTVAYTIAGLADGPLTVGIPAGQLKDAYDNPYFTPFSASYTVDRPTQPLPALRAVNPAGSLAYQTSAADLIDFAGDGDQFTLAADPGQTLTVVVAATAAGLQPSVQLSDPSHHVLATATAAGPGQDALLQAVKTTTGGTYTVTVTGAASTTGTYTVAVYLDAVVGASAYGIGTNNTRTTAQSLNSSFVTVQTSLSSASQAAVLGSVGFAPATLNAVFSGWWDNTGYHDPTNPNYIAGQYNNPPLEKWHDFFVFDLSGISHPIVGAQLALSNPSDGYYSTRSSDTYSVFNVTTPVSSVEAVGSGTNNPSEVAIYTDLGSGTKYGSATVSSASDGQTVSVGLNSSAVSALNGARGSQFALGGALTTATGSNDQAIFADTGNDSQTKQLVLTFSDTHYYSFTLAAGQAVTVSLKNLTGSGDTIALLNSGGKTLATGTAGAADLDQQISNFVAATAGTYYIMVSDSTTNATCDLVVTRAGAFDAKLNATMATAQDVTGTRGAVGALTSTAGAVVPGADSGVETNDGNAYPFSFVSTMRYQQIYSASQLAAGGTISSIQFRRVGWQGGPFTATPINLNISLAYAATTVATASQTFADNIGTGGLVNVYSGSLVLASTAPEQTPEAFDVIINLMHNFTYDPTKGDLLLDISVYSGSANPFFLEADAQDTTRIFAFDVNEPVGNMGLFGPQNGPYGLVTRFGFVAPPPPEWYKVTLAANQTALQVETSTPLGGPNQALNALNPNIQLFDSSGNLLMNGGVLADGRNQSLLATGLTPGATYYVEISSANGSTGEYFLGVAPLQTPTFSVTVDDGGPGFSTSGSGWTTVTGTGYDGGEHTHTGVPGGTGYAQWLYSENVTAGNHYAIFATWAAAPTNATNATYKIYDGTKLLAKVTVDQTRSPNTGLLGSTLVQQLYVFTPTTTGTHTIKIQLSDNANGVVAADAVFDPPVFAPDPTRPAEEPPEAHPLGGGGVVLPMGPDPWSDAATLVPGFLPNVPGTPVSPSLDNPLVGPLPGAGDSAGAAISPRGIAWVDRPDDFTEWEALLASWPDLHSDPAWGK
jgi:hypothetical protein